MTLVLPKEFIEKLVRRHLQDFITEFLDYTMKTGQDEEFIDKLPRVFLHYIATMISVFAVSYEETLLLVAKMLDENKDKEKEQGDQ